MSEETKCTICGGNELDQVSYLYTHKDLNEKLHILCKPCILEFAKVCTCNKKFIEEEPHKISIRCPECPEEESLKYFDIVHGENFRELLRQWSEDYYIIDGCRGCSFNIHDIQKEFKYAKQAAITACVYKVMHLDDQEIDEENTEHKSGYIYVSDALDEDFIERATLFGAKLGDEVELVAS